MSGLTVGGRGRQTYRWLFSLSKFPDGLGPVAGEWPLLGSFQGPGDPVGNSQEAAGKPSANGFLDTCLYDFSPLEGCQVTWDTSHVQPVTQFLTHSMRWDKHSLTCHSAHLEKVCSHTGGWYMCSF